MSTAVDSWDSWLEDQAAPKKRAVAGGNGEAAGDDTPQVHPVAQLDASAKDEFVKLAAEVEQAQRAAQAGKKSGNKGRKKREREEREPKKVVAVTSESFEALKQRLLAQTLEPVTEAATEGGGESNVKRVADGEAKVSKSKLKRQRKKAAAAKKQKQKKNAGGKQPAADSSDVVVAAATTTGTDSVINDGAASSHKAEKARGDEESVAAPSADAEAGAPSSAPADPMCAIAERYLELWHESNAVGGGGPSKGPRRWKFKKAVQIWLLQNACYKQRLSGAGFKRFLKYLKGLKGKAASTTLEQTEALRARYSAAAEATDSAAAELLLADSKAAGDKPAKIVARADKVLKVLRKICAAQASKLRLQDKEE